MPCTCRGVASRMQYGGCQSRGPMSHTVYQHKSDCSSVLYHCVAASRVATKIHRLNWLHSLRLHWQRDVISSDVAQILKAPNVQFNLRSRFNACSSDCSGVAVSAWDLCPTRPLSKQLISTPAKRPSASYNLQTGYWCRHSSLSHDQNRCH